MTHIVFDSIAMSTRVLPVLCHDGSEMPLRAVASCGLLCFDISVNFNFSIDKNDRERNSKTRKTSCFVCFTNLMLSSISKV